MQIMLNIMDDNPEQLRHATELCAFLFNHLGNADMLIVTLQLRNAASQEKREESMFEAEVARRVKEELQKRGIEP